MERHFTVKDFFLFTALLTLFIAMLLAMYMVDRQWLKLSDMQRTLTEQASDLRELRGTIKELAQRPVTAAATTTSATPTQASAIPPAFRRAHAMTQKADYAEGDWLVNAFGVNLKTITPLISSDAYAADVQSYILETLLTRDRDTLEWQGLLAKSWQVSEDGLTITFNMRDDVKFSDGQPLTARDVAFTFNFIMNPVIAAPRQRVGLEKLASVIALDDYRVEFKFKEPYFEALGLAGGMEILAQHFYEPFLKEPEKFNESKGLLIGSGPYRLADPSGWTPDGGFVELEQNPRYWAPVHPSFKRIHWKIIQNDSARLTTYRNGEIDQYGARPIEYQKLLNDAELMALSQHYEYMSSVAGYSYIGWNQLRNDKATRFADPRVRKAMTLLTDQSRIISDIFLGYAEPAVSPFHPQSKQHLASLTPFAFDIAQAQSLLKESGYEDRNGDGVIEAADGTPFKFELVFFQDNEDTKRMVLLLKDLYARAGVQLEPKPTEWAVMLDLLKKKDFDAITLGWTSGIETDIYQMFHSTQTIVDGDNFINYKNPKLDKLIEQARATVDEAKRMPLWQESERILYEDQPYTFLMRRKSLVFINNRFRNVEVNRLGINFGSTPIENYVPAALQKYRQ